MNSENAVPSIDGDITPYVSPSARKSHSWASRQALFINGIQNTPSDHQKSALLVSSAIEGKVLGVYNKMRPYQLQTLVQFVKQYQNSIPEWMDTAKPDCNTAAKVTNPLSLQKANALVQDAKCVAGTTAQAIAAIGYKEVIAPGTRALLGAMAKGLSAIDAAQSMSVDVAQCGLDVLTLTIHKMAGSDIQRLATQFPEAFKNIILGYFSSINPAVGALLERLARNRWPTGRCTIVAHSQGNLVTSCALSALECLNLGSCRPFQFTGPMQVFSVASPAYRWPDCGATIKCYSHVGDVVTFLSAGESQFRKGAVVERGYTHGFETYLSDNSTLRRDLRAWVGLGPSNSSLV